MCGVYILHKCFFRISLYSKALFFFLKRKTNQFCYYTGFNLPNLVQPCILSILKMLQSTHLYFNPSYFLDISAMLSEFIPVVFLASAAVYEVVEFLAVLGCFAAWVGSWLLKFQYISTIFKSQWNDMLFRNDRNQLPTYAAQYPTRSKTFIPILCVVVNVAVWGTGTASLL